MSTGLPTSTRLTKLTPFFTRPSSTSRQGIIRFANIKLLSIECQSIYSIGYGQ